MWLRREQIEGRESFQRFPTLYPVDPLSLSRLDAGRGRLSALGARGDRAVWQNGDFNYDSRIGARDLALLRSNFGATMPAAALSTDVGAVPEPAAAASLLLLATFALRRRRRTASKL